MQITLTRSHAVLFASGFAMALLLSAAPVKSFFAGGDVPFTFTAGETASADEVNANFTNLDGRLDTLNAFVTSGALDGDQGPAGPTGPQGPTGPTGPQGAQGNTGNNGADGSDGADGAQGPAGPTGPIGPAGPTGPAGEDGSDGESLPTGTIVLWGGSIASIPTGWTLCDGSAGAPDLQDLFVVGAGGTFAVDDSGGSIEHVHTYTVHGGGMFGGSSGGAAGTGTYDTDPANHLPPYYALAYIMKL